MKKIWMLLLSAMMVLCLAGCGNDAKPAPASSSSSQPAASAKPAASSANTQNTDKDKQVVKVDNKDKILVVYFSHSGNTKTVAEKIHNMVGGDIVEIKTKVPYPQDYDTVVDQGKKEIESNFKPEITTKIDKMPDYSTVIIGTPVWWYHMAPPINTFLSEYDFTGKTVVPFCTHGGSVGATIEDIQGAKGCKPVKGIDMYGSEAANSDNLLKAWLTEIGLMK